MRMGGVLLAGGVALMAAQAAGAADFETMVTGGSIQLGGKIVLSVRDGDKAVPDGATCGIEIAAPYAAHLSVVSGDCAALTLQQGVAPILDDAGHALPSAQVPYQLVVRAADGAEVGRVAGIYPYNNQFSDLRIVLKGIRNPVAVGQSYQATVLGAGKPIDASLTCRWHTYGPVRFEPASENGCIGKLTAQAPGGADGDMDVEIVNLTDMHAVGYATARIVVK